MEESAPEKRRTYPFRFIHKWMLTIMILYLSYYFSNISVSHHLQTYTEKPSPKNISGNSELDVRNIDLPKAVRRKPKRRGRHLASLRQFPDCYIFRQMAYPLPPRIWSLQPSCIRSSPPCRSALISNSSALLFRQMISSASSSEREKMYKPASFLRTSLNFPYVRTGFCFRRAIRRLKKSL